MKRILIIVAASLALAVPAAHAANWPNATLDQASSSVAGHAVSVYCEDSWLPWISYFLQFGQDGTFIGGFTRLSAPVVYVNPRQCEGLHALVNHEDIGTYYAASVLLTLAHESVHQRGGEFANCTSTDKTCEGRTECAALPLVSQLATQFFGIPPTFSDAYLIGVTTKRKVGKKTIAVRTNVVRYRTLPNPYLTRLATDAQRWHATKPAEYKTFC